MATTMAAGAFAMAVMAPHAVADSDSSNALQPVVDQLLDAQQQVEDIDSKYPFIVPSDVGPLLHEYTQNLAQTTLAIQLFGLHQDAISSGPPPWNAGAANPQEFLAFPNEDDAYDLLPVDPDKTYEVTFHPGPGTQDVIFEPDKGDGVTQSLFPVADATKELKDLTPNPDGSYTVFLSATPHSGNWVDTAGAGGVLMRDTVGDWGQIHDSFNIQVVGAPPSSLAIPPLTQDQISSFLNTVATNEVQLNHSTDYLGQQAPPDMVPDNTFSSIAFRGGAPLGGPQIASQVTSIGHFSLQPDQALIVKVPDIDAAYTGFQITNDWGQTAPYATVQGSLNDTQTFQAADGFTYYVVSSQDPGVANWVDDSGLTDGDIQLRWQSPTSPNPIPTTPIQTEVVNVADVRNDLPTDTPVVTPAEYADDFKNRLFEYDYDHDQNNNIAWLYDNLEYDQIKNAIGASQFDEIFGSQSQLQIAGASQDVPSVLDRMTPALSPDASTVDQDILTHPIGSLTAIINNLPLAIQDVELPTLFALLQLKEAVEGGPGAPTLGTVFNDMMTDPTTSITAGMLNARDDLAVAVMNQSDSTSLTDTLWQSLSNLNQSVAQTVIPTLFDPVGSTGLLDATDTASAGADLTPGLLP